MKIIDALKEVKDDRKPNGKEYQLWEIILFSIFAIASNAKTYSDIQRFMECNFDNLVSVFELKWGRSPTISCVWKILTRIDFSDMEQVFMKYFSDTSEYQNEIDHICFDGKVLRGSDSKTQDKSESKILSAFSAVSKKVLGHLQLESEKDSEIPALQEFLRKLNLKGVVVSADALHCQKKLLNQLKMQKQF
ncbi:hypothetical protein FACS189449_05010 [Alphaproteobacteria bacterium]|nr:hypothetical protein FACS189449_05010 [Alphaproteobacteria bacterium]